MVNVEDVKKMGQELIDDEELKQIIEKIEEENEEEAKFFLKLSTFKNNCYPDRPYREHYQVLFGDITEVVTYEVKDSCTEDKEVVIIPKTKAVIILYYDGFGNPAIVYTFSINKGWVQTFL